MTAQTLITQEFGKLASKAIGDYALIKMNEAASVGDPIATAAWSEGGSARIALHAIVGGLSAGTSGAIGAATSQAAIEPLAQTIKNADLPIELKHTLIAAAGTAVGVVASGGHVAGGVTAFNALDNNYLTHNKLKDEISELNKLKQQRQSETCDVVCIDRIHDLETLDMLRDEKLLPLIAACEKAGRNNCKGEVIAQQFAVVNGLGAESMKRESNPGTLGSPFSFNNCPSIDKGGCSYGPLQIAANTGMMQNFMDSLRSNPSDEAQSFYKELQAAGGVVASKEASPLFIQTWMKLTAKDPQFVQYQIDALINLNLYPVVEELQKVGIDFDNLSRSQKEALFSAAVQHGAGVSAKKIGADNVLERTISVAQTDIQAPSFPTYTRQELVYGQVEDQMRAAEASKANLINQREGTITQREAFISQQKEFISQQLQLERQKNQLFEQGFNANADDIVFIQKQIQVLDSKISKINSQVNEKTEKVDKLTRKVEEQDQYIKEAGQYLKAQAQASMANVEQWLKDFYQQRTQMYPSEAKRYQLELDSLLKQYRQEQQGSKK